ACAELSVTENNQQHKKDNGIANNAGPLNGTTGVSEMPKVSTHTALDSTIKVTAVTRPATPPITAPRVVKPFQNMDNTSTGKLAHAATENARPTMKATFCFSNRIPRIIAKIARPKVASLDIRSSDSGVVWPFFNTLAYKSCEIAEAPDRVRPATTARMVANATAEMKPMNRSPPTASDRCTA